MKKTSHWHLNVNRCGYIHKEGSVQGIWRLLVVLQVRGLYYRFTLTIMKGK